VEHELILLPFHLGQFDPLAQREDVRHLHPGVVLLLSVFVRENEPPLFSLTSSCSDK
jgi:hypothetical protein